MGTKFNKEDIVKNINDNKKYYVENVEMIYNVDSKESYPTGYYECKPLEEEHPAYNRFQEKDLEKAD